MRPWDSMERRKLPRYEISLSCDETDLGSYREFHSITRDICEQGVGITLNERLPLDASVQVCLAMPDNREQIYLRGKVVWIIKLEENNFRAGILLDKFDLRPIPLVLRMIKFQLKSRYYQ
ncbi:MAG: PilZ domain-containing protein [Candidatus Omnitrophica bacterium]|nr:PilZ domain-containing protein [Candidatus Omnitrophota bacterium]